MDFPWDGFPGKFGWAAEKFPGKSWNPGNVHPHFLGDPFQATTPPALPVDQGRHHPGGSGGYWVGATRISHSPDESIDQKRRRDNSDRFAS